MVIGESNPKILFDPLPIVSCMEVGFPESDIHVGRESMEIKAKHTVFSMQITSA